MNNWTFYFFKSDKSELSKKAFSKVKQLDKVRAKFINDIESESFKKYQKDCFFIFSDFRGCAFQHLRNLKMHILHPSIVISCLQHNKPLPIFQFPVINCILQNQRICSSGFNQEDKSRLYDFIEMMGGTPYSSLTETVNVLIVENILSRKYFIAKKRDLICLKRGWIDAIWSMSSKLVEFNPFSHNLLHKYDVSTFYNLKITLSGLSISEKENYRNKITNNGGEYLSNLQNDVTSVLVANDASGNKCFYAHQWNIPIVTCKWLDDSLTLKFCQDIDNYKLRIPENINKFDDTDVFDDVDALIDFDEFIDLFSDYCFKFENCTNESMLDLTQKIEYLGGTTIHNSPDTKPTHLIIDELPFNGELDENICLVKPIWIDKCYENKIKVDIEPYLLNAIDVLGIDTDDFDEVDENKFLKNTILYFYKCTSKFIGKYTKLAEEKGAEIVESINLRPTHIIIDGESAPDFSDTQLVCLRKEWLIHSLENNEKVDENEYKINRNQVSLTEDEILATINEDDFSDDNDNDDDLFDDMLSDIDCNMSMVNPEPKLGKLFSGQRFLLTDSLNRNITKSILDNITDHSGEIVPTGLDCNFIVTSTVILQPIKKKSNIKVVTNIYIKNCIKENQILDISSNFLFEPIIKTEINTKLFDKCVFYMSVMGVEELSNDHVDELKHLVKLFGGKIQEALITEENSKFMYKTTHVITWQDEFSDSQLINSDILIVRKLWLEECIKQKQLINVDSYSIKQIIESSEKINDDDKIGDEIDDEIDDDDIDDFTDINSSFEMEEPDEKTKLKCISGKILTALSTSTSQSNPPHILTKCVPVSTEDGNVSNKISASSWDETRAKASLTNWKQKESTVNTQTEIQSITVNEDVNGQINKSRLPQRKHKKRKLDDETIENNEEKENRLNIKKEPKNGASNSCNHDEKTSPTTNRFVDSNVLFRHYQNKSDTLSQQCVVGWQYVTPLSKHFKPDEPNANVTHASTSTHCPTVTKIKREEHCSTAKSPLIRIDSSNKKFMFSQVHDNDRSRYTRYIEQLGGVIINSSSYDHSMTHLIVSKLTKCEKVLATICSGKYLLDPKFLDTSFSIGQWADESDYEWCNLSIYNQMESVFGNDKVGFDVACRMVRGYQYWRKKDKKPFVDWTVIVLDKSDREARFKSILSAGGAKTIDIPTTPFVKKKGKSIFLANDITHCICASNKVDLPPGVLLGGPIPARRKFPVIRTQYIPDYLFKFGNAPTAEFEFSKEEIALVNAELKRNHKDNNSH